MSQGKKITKPEKKQTSPPDTNSPPASNDNKNVAQTSQDAQSLIGNNPIVHGFTVNKKSKSPIEWKKPLFLTAYYEQFTVTHTCGAIGISRRTFYAWMEDDENFNKAFTIVENSITERMMRTAMARGIRGSDNLLMFMLKYRDPAFRDKAVAELDPKTVDNLVNTFVEALRKNVPDACPHCHVNLNLSGKVSKMLMSLSKPMVS